MGCTSSSPASPPTAHMTGATLVGASSAIHLDSVEMLIENGVAEDLKTVGAQMAPGALVDAAEKGDAEMDASGYDNAPNTDIRQELGCVLYAPNVLGSRGPRKMQVCINKVDPQEGMHLWQPRSKDAEMLNMFKNKDENGMKNLVSMVNKPPQWNDQLSAFVLNFNNRVTKPSVKNFQLVDQFDHEKIILQFGRVAKDEFTMDFQWPITPFQAFAIALSSFDNKIACE
ncbi:hypothetical protein TeGR_g610 [Tetraparma gracilis]|uniref:Tubby C-terminal domain-containing protein n=1 Tax=Tetraparma gracilis TaxID=2962635 RepID=A0ABQ6MKP9_9STRA|nr:hypothetical protein TeGR_g610 [Tetraparma gracilis]